VLIDTEDLKILDKLDLSWHLTWDEDTNGYYVKATKYIGMIDDKPKYEPALLHIEIMNPNHLPNFRVDHLSGDTLDNRKANLRLVSSEENSKHRTKINKNNSSGERNVSWNNKDKKWVVQLQVNKKNTIFGRFEYDELDKAIALAKKLRKEIYGEINV
jgi:hypothetical protein